MKTLHDIYRCPDCDAIAAHGNNFCRECGVKFDATRIAKMQANIQSVVGAVPWNLRDAYKCVHCLEHICIEDCYCRGCGDHIDDQERQLMRLRLDELAKDNMGSLIGLMIFVIVVIFLVSQ